MDPIREQKILDVIGNKLKIIRLEKGYSLRELADRADMDHNNIHRIEQGMVNPAATTLVLLAEALGVKPADLMP